MKIEQVKRPILRLKDRLEMASSCFVNPGKCLVTLVEQRIVPGRHLMPIKPQRAEFPGLFIEHDMISNWAFFTLLGRKRFRHCRADNAFELILIIDRSKYRIEIEIEDQEGQQDMVPECSLPG